MSAQKGDLCYDLRNMWKALTWMAILAFWSGVAWMIAGAAGAVPEEFVLIGLAPVVAVGIFVERAHPHIRDTSGDSRPLRIAVGTTATLAMIGVIVAGVGLFINAFALLFGRGVLTRGSWGRNFLGCVLGGPTIAILGIWGLIAGVRYITDDQWWS